MTSEADRELRSRLERLGRQIEDVLENWDSVPEARKREVLEQGRQATEAAARATLDDTQRYDDLDDHAAVIDTLNDALDEIERRLDASAGSPSRPASRSSQSPSRGGGASSAGPAGSNRGGLDRLTLVEIAGLGVGFLLLLFGGYLMMSEAFGTGFLLMGIGLVLCFLVLLLTFVEGMSRADTPEQREALLDFARMFFVGNDSGGSGRSGGAGSRRSDEGFMGFSGFTNLGNSDPSSTGMIDRVKSGKGYLSGEYFGTPKCPNCGTEKVHELDDGVYQCARGHTFRTNAPNRQEVDLNVSRDE